MRYSLLGLSHFSASLLQSLAPNLSPLLDLFPQLRCSVNKVPVLHHVSLFSTLVTLSVLFISVPSSTHANPSPFFYDLDTLAPT